TILNKSGAVSPTKAEGGSTVGLIGGSVDWRPTTWWRTAFQSGVERTARRESSLTSSYQCAAGTCVSGTGSRGEVQGEMSVYTARLQMSAIPTLRWADRFLSLRPSFGADFRKTEKHVATVNGYTLAAGSEDIATAQTIRG